MYKIKSDKKLFIYILSLIGISLVAILLFVNRPVYLECRFGPYKDKNGIFRTDFLPTSVLKINKITRKLTFYHLGSIKKPDYNISMSDSVSFRKSGRGYTTDFVKQKKLDDNEKYYLKNKDKEYLFQEIKDEEYMMVLDRSSLMFSISWKHSNNKFIKEHFPDGMETYTCSFPKKQSPHLRVPV